MTAIDSRNQSARKRATRLRTTRLALALLQASAALLFAAAPAAAQQICGNVLDAADDTLDLHLQNLGFGIGVPVDDEEVCEKLTGYFVKGCLDAIRRVSDCLLGQFSSLAKQNKYACKATPGGGGSSCVDEVEEELKAGRQALKQLGADVAEECEGSAADEYFDVCMNGL
jgi:hypothetical protein